MRDRQKMKRAGLETKIFLGEKKMKSEIKVFQAGNGAARLYGAAVQVPVCPLAYRKQLIFSVSFCHP